MSISINEFWKLTIAAGLLTLEDCRPLHAEFMALDAKARAAGTASLADWLIKRGKLTGYQASLLLEGKPGPFVFGDYTVVDRVSQGRLNRWFKAKDPQGEGVLLVFASQLALSDADVAQQTAAAMSIRSPHVSGVRAYVEGQANSIIVAEDMTGQSLRERLAAGKLDRDTATKIIFQLSMAVAAMHAQNLSHGKICPENVWIEPSGTVKLLQFPFVSAATIEQLSKPPMIDYLAPDVIESRIPASPSADVYSLGCIAFELIAGQVPFAEGNPRQKMLRHQQEAPRRLDKLLSGVPEDLADLVVEMLEKDPLLRRQSADLPHLLAPLATGLSLREASPPQIEPRALTTGYGAWRAKEFQAPPQTVMPVQRPAPAAAPVETPQVFERATASQFGLPKRRQSNGALIGGGIAVALMVVFVLLVFLFAGGDQQKPTEDDATPLPATPVATAEATDTPEQPAPPAVEDKVAENKPVDDVEKPAARQPRPAPEEGRLLWASPTTGEPPVLDYLPSGAQAIIICHPAAILQTSEGARLFDVLGSGGDWLKDTLRSTLGVDLMQVEELQVAFTTDASESVQASFVIRLAEPIDEAALVAAWGKPERAEIEKKPAYRGARLGYYLPASDRVVIAPLDQMREILARRDAPAFRRGIERLLADCDASRHFNLLVAPSFLFTDGQALLAGDLEKLREPLSAFLGDGVDSLLVSAQLGDELFLELRAVGPADKRPDELARVLQLRLEKLSEQLETYVASMQPAAYGRLVVNRFPRMVQLLADFTRAGAENREAVLRCYLPGVAAHNLLLASQLTLLEPAGVAAVEIPPPAKVTPRTAAGALDKKITLSFPRDTLERCLELLSKEIEVPIVILGGDLQLEGITKNQSFALDERDQRARDVLDKVLARSNADGKLVYVIKPQGGMGEAIFITTRAAAAKRNDPLPAEFRSKNGKE